MAGYGEALLGGALSIAGGLANNSMAAWREKTAREDNYYYGELAAGNADKRARKLYEDYQSPEAMMRQLKEAGLSPSLMYGNGTGGTVGQGAQGTGAAGISPTTYGVSPLEAAQIGLINAQTEKTKTENENISTNTQKQKAEIDNIVQETKNKELIACWQELQNGIAQMDLNLKGEYGEDEVKAYLGNLNAQTENLKTTLRSLVVKADIDEKTANDIITYTRNKVCEQYADIFLKNCQAQLAQAQIQLTKDQAQMIMKQLSVVDDYVDISRRGVKVEEDKLQAQIEQWAKENGFRNKALNLALTKIIAGFIQSENHEFLNTLVDLSGLVGKKPNRISGLQ